MCVRSVELADQCDGKGRDSGWQALCRGVIMAVWLFAHYSVLFALTADKSSVATVR